MATTYTTLLGYALPTTGELDGVWGDEVNNSITQLVEDSVANYATADVTSGNWALSTTGSGLTNEARMAILIATGNPGVTRNVVAPSHSKFYLVCNQSDADIVVKGAATTGVTILAGLTSIVVWDGSDFVEVSPTFATYVTNILGGVHGSVPYQSAVNETSLLAPGTAGQVLTTNGAGVDPSWTTIIPSQSTNNGKFLTTNGSALSWADIAATTFSWTAKQSFVGTSTNLTAVLSNAAEKVTVSATAASGTINYDITTQSVLYYTTSASANWTMNFRASSGTSLNTALGTGESVTVTFLATNGTTAYYNSAVTVDGTSVTPKYQGGVTWSYGTPSGIDAYTYTIIKTAAATFTVLASQVRFA